MVREARLFLLALQFLTRLPVPRSLAFSPEDFRDSARYFPLVGLLVGLIGAVVLSGASLVFPYLVAVLLSLTATLLVTGAFHEDGLADSCDGLGGAVDRERALAIMKDSRIGSYGAIGLFCVLGLKVAALASLPLPLTVAAGLLAHTSSRAAALTLARWLPYAGEIDRAKAGPLMQRLSAGNLLVGWSWPLLLAGGLVASQPMWIWPVLLGLGLALFTAIVAKAWLQKRLGGMNGDTLGATQQVSELLVLLGWLAWLRAWF
jgi:adenosylcobinamide-GDP ribazoletransferase